ncbi:hypothetical protein [Pantoea sp. Z09]|uniref:hypothetical protein n=1 Tax=Pantoea sp. Z09 TaxID=2886821 RepID=UPI001EFE5932|nr:hypothetical protein [Pantoea sp. Z09]
MSRFAVVFGGACASSGTASLLAAGPWLNVHLFAETGVNREIAAQKKTAPRGCRYRFTVAVPGRRAHQGERVGICRFAAVRRSLLIAIPALLFISGYRRKRNGELLVFYHHIASNLGD